MPSRHVPQITGLRLEPSSIRLGASTLKCFCAENVSFFHTRPIRCSGADSKMFIAYGLAFQRHLVPDVEGQSRSLRWAGRPMAFYLRLDDGELVHGRPCCWSPSA